MRGGNYKPLVLHLPLSRAPVNSNVDIELVGLCVLGCSLSKEGVCNRSSLNIATKRWWVK